MANSRATCDAAGVRRDGGPRRRYSLDVRIHDERDRGARDGVIEVWRAARAAGAAMTLSHTPPGVTGGPVLGLIGKGVTFDTGGIRSSRPT
jgi:leucyl aminopeptidase